MGQFGHERDRKELPAFPPPPTVRIALTVRGVATVQVTGSTPGEALAMLDEVTEQLRARDIPVAVVDE